MTPMLGIMASSISGSKANTNSYESIQTVTVGTAQSVVSFTSIPGTYKHLQIRTLYQNTSAQSNIRMTYNSDTAANYSWHEVDGYGQPSPEASGTANASFMSIILGATGTTNLAVGITDILEYANTNIYKTCRTLTGADTNGGINYILFRSGNWRSTSAITRIDLTASAGNFGQYSSIALYGIKA
jgi:hypothetical protein